LLNGGTVNRNCDVAEYILMTASVAWREMGMGIDKPTKQKRKTISDGLSTIHAINPDKYHHLAASNATDIQHDPL
jgi:hypothetical protein